MHYFFSMAGIGPVSPCEPCDRGFFRSQIGGLPKFDGTDWWNGLLKPRKTDNWPTVSNNPFNSWRKSCSFPPRKVLDKYFVHSVATAVHPHFNQPFSHPLCPAQVPRVPVAQQALKPHLQDSQSAMFLGSKRGWQVGPKVIHRVSKFFCFHLERWKNLSCLKHERDAFRSLCFCNNFSNFRIQRRVAFKIIKLKKYFFRARMANTGHTSHTGHLLVTLVIQGMLARNFMSSSGSYPNSCTLAYHGWRFVAETPRMKTPEVRWDVQLYIQSHPLFFVIQVSESFKFVCGIWKISCKDKDMALNRRRAVLQFSIEPNTNTVCVWLTAHYVCPFLVSSPWNPT